MKAQRVFLAVLLSLVFVTTLTAGEQSGRKLKVVTAPPPPVGEQSTETEKKRQQDGAPPVAAEKSEVYVCSDDKTLARVLDPEAGKEQTYTMKQVDTPARILTRPAPSYTREARRAGIQGYVILRVVLSSGGKIGRIKVLRGLPLGLTESGIRAACKIKFQPAVKDSLPVSQSLQVEYTFSLSHSPIFRP